MSVPAIAFVAVFLGVLALLIWRLATLNTDPPGYVMLARFDALGTARHAKALLEGAGIPVILQDHTGGWTAAMVVPGSPGGAALVLVPKQDAQRAQEILAHRQKTQHLEHPPA